MSVLLLEPFYGGSHKQLMDLVASELGPQQCRLVTLPATKWHWRARTAALWLAERIEPSAHYRVLLASGVLNLAELLGLRPDLAPLRKLLYMHENQLVYPVRKEQQRDYQYGYNQVASCLAADVVLFNSCFNRDSFLSAVEAFVGRVPGAGRLAPLRPRIAAKSQVLPFPLQLPPRTNSGGGRDDPGAPLHIVWPHRWEHDKGPEAFVEALCELHQRGLPFHVSFLGQGFSELPPCLLTARERLPGHVVQWGPLAERSEYLALLRTADVVVSTASHEFYGVAMLTSIFVVWSFCVEAWKAGGCHAGLLPAVPRPAGLPRDLSPLLPVPHPAPAGQAAAELLPAPRSGPQDSRTVRRLAADVLSRGNPSCGATAAAATLAVGHCWRRKEDSAQVPLASELHPQPMLCLPQCSDQPFFHCLQAVFLGGAD
ncbi:tRNA-queuosine alpha-mannosyltransferase isoform X2 [Haemaphysalis longicornis]